MQSKLPELIEVSSWENHENGGLSSKPYLITGRYIYCMHMVKQQLLHKMHKSATPQLVTTTLKNVHIVIYIYIFIYI